jgi:hypothetical protein
MTENYWNESDIFKPADILNLVCLGQPFMLM